MKRAVVGVAAIGILALVGGCHAESASAPRAADTAPSTTPSVATPSPAAPTTVAPVTTPVTVPAPPSPAPVAAPMVYTGVGDRILPITKPAGATTVIATITGNAARHYFGVRALDGEGDHLVDTTASYSGSTLLDAHGGHTTQLRVHAYGSWTITLTDPRSAPVFDHGYSGTGDTVLIYEGGPGSAAVTGGSGAPFTVTMYAGGAEDDLVRSTGSFAGAVRWPAGPGLVVVSAEGPWSIVIS